MEGEKTAQNSDMLEKEGIDYNKREENKRKTEVCQDEDDDDIIASDSAEQEKHISKKPRKGKPGFDCRMFTETTFSRKNGLRHVKPYFFTFTAHCKGRWLGHKLIDIFKKEFRMRSVEYYERAIKTGKITLNDKIVSQDTMLTSNHVVRTQVHRHEPPVVDKQFDFVENNDLMVVIDKPSSIPVHPCGRYRHNTVVFILGEEYGLTNLHTIHRIDRLTSGILMFAKTKQKAQEMEQCVKGRLVKKEYLCRVQGRFPNEPIVCKKAIKVVSHKVGVCQVHPEGKEAVTEFLFESFNGQSSVVRCIPSTGRMHQIRVHLQYIGFPILNDPIYNHPTAWGPNRGEGGNDGSIDDVLKILADTRKDKPRNRISSNNQADDCLSENKTEKQISDEQPSLSNPSDQCRNSNQDRKLLDACSNDDSFDYDCTDCLNPMPDPSEDDLVMYLHALKYTGPGWQYETKVPSWAKADSLS
eukprot:gene11158-12330_t